MTVIVLLTVIGSKDYSLLQNLLAPTKLADKGFNEIVQVLHNHLSPKPLIIAERFKFHQRNQEESELVAQYLAELHQLSDKYEFGEYLEQALRDRLASMWIGGQKDSTQTVVGGQAIIEESF